jgi:hypothetical protein
VQNIDEGEFTQKKNEGKWEIEMKRNLDDKKEDFNECHWHFIKI